MSSSHAQELARLLGVTEQDLAFVDYLGGDVGASLAAGVRARLEADARAIDAAVEQAAGDLPAGIGGIVKQLLPAGRA